MEKPVPSAEGKMSTSAKLSLAEIAMQLRDEQLQARVVHYKGELQTSPELDAVTAQVIAELKMLQGAGRPHAQGPRESDRAQVEIDLIATLKSLLSKLFSQQRVAVVVERKLGEVSKRFARLFFESELHEKIRGGGSQLKTMRYGEQAIYHVMAHNEDRLLKELDAFEYATADVKEDARDALQNWVKELRNEFLGRTTPELNALVRILNEVLSLFFTQELPPVAGELAWEVVKEAKLADGAMRGGYKVPADSFASFRKTFERRFLHVSFRSPPTACSNASTRAKESSASRRCASSPTRTSSATSASSSAKQRTTTSTTRASSIYPPTGARA